MALPEVSLVVGDDEEKESSVARSGDHGCGFRGVRGCDHGGGSAGSCGGRCYTHISGSSGARGSSCGGGHGSGHGDGDTNGYDGCGGQCLAGPANAGEESTSAG